MLSTLGNLLENESKRTERIIALNGHDLERWCLKALCGFLARADRCASEAWVRILFGSRSLLQPLGLYFYAEVGDVLAGEGISLEEVRVKGAESIGLVARLLSHELVFSMSTDTPVTLERHVGKMRVFRPESFTFRNPTSGSTQVLWLSWQDSLYHAPIDVVWGAIG
jgi:hypothetical protein